MEYKNVKIIRVDKCVKVQTFEREVCLLTAEYSFLKQINKGVIEPLRTGDLTVHRLSSDTLHFSRLE